MQENKQRFIELAIQNKVLRFGEFTLKSGRTSPYFFNAGLFNSGQAIAALGQCYAQAIVDNRIDCDVIFGPAYKGIPLVTATVYALASEHGIDKPFAFNRKEAKDHGEGGTIVGATVQGKTLIVDDVITAGTAIREAVGIIQAQTRAGVDTSTATASAVLIAMDRQERGKGALSAIQEVQQTFDMQVYSIITLQDLIDFMQTDKTSAQHLSAMQAYREQYGIE